MSKLGVRPLFDNVLIKPLQAEEKTPSGIVLPDSAKEKPLTGEIMAIGPGVMEDGEIVKNSMQVKVGEKVFYKRYGGDEVKVNGQDWIMVRQSEILGVFE